MPNPAPLSDLRTQNADLAARLGSLTTAHDPLKADNAALQRQLSWFKRQLFGRRSEKQIPFDPTEQANLFAALGVEPGAAPAGVEQSGRTKS